MLKLTQLEVHVMFGLLSLGVHVSSWSNLCGCCVGFLMAHHVRIPMKELLCEYIFLSVYRQ